MQEEPSAVPPDPAVTKEPDVRAYAPEESPKVQTSSWEQVEEAPPAPAAIAPVEQQPPAAAATAPVEENPPAPPVIADVEEQPPATTRPFVPPPPPRPQTPPTFVPAPPPSLPRGQSSRNIGIAIGIAAVVLAAAGGAWGWYVYKHRAVSTTAGTSPDSQPVTTATPGQKPNPGTAAAPQAPSNPSPSNPASSSPVASAPNAPQNRANSVSTPRPSNPPMPAPQKPGLQASNIAPQPRITQPQPSQPPPPPPPASPRSGVLHYQGPPVPYNGEVVFDHLPKTRLRFVYDRQGWMLTIKVNPDGTKRVTMTSQKAGYQAYCDLSWEAVE
jgi:hypothetical protein